MTERTPKVPGVVKKASSKGIRPKNPAFDIWLERGLHQLYDDVAREPIPDELLRLIQEDKDK